MSEMRNQHRLGELWNKSFTCWRFNNSSRYLSPKSYAVQASLPLSDDQRLPFPVIFEITAWNPPSLGQNRSRHGNDVANAALLTQIRNTVRPAPDQMWHGIGFDSSGYCENGYVPFLVGF